MKFAVRFLCVLLLFSAVPGAQTSAPLAEYAFSDGPSAGRFGAGLQFSGGAGVMVPVGTFSGAFTFESWINPASYIWSDFWKQMPDWRPANPRYTLSLTSDGALYFSAYQGAAMTNYPLFTVQTVPLDTWTHVAVTYDGSEIRIYFNAVEVARRFAGGNLTATSQPVEIGADFHGRIDEVRIYSRALSPAEIALDRATPVDPSTPLQVSIVTPADRSAGVSTTPISATFSAPVDPATVNTSTFSLRDAGGAIVPASVTYDPATRTALLTPSTPLQPLADYTARVGEGSPADASWTFRTASPESQPRVALAFSDNDVAADASGNANVTTFRHGAHSTPGMFGNGVGLDGIDDEIQIAASDTTSMTGAFTFEAWINPASYTWGDLWSLCPDNAVNSSFIVSFWMTDTGTLFTSAVLGGSYYPMFTTVTLSLNAWTHVALT